MKARRKIAAGAALAIAALAPAVALAGTPEAYDKVGRTITKGGIRQDLFGGAAGTITMEVLHGKAVCVAKANGTIKLAKTGDCKLRFTLAPASGAAQKITVLLHVTKTGKNPEGGG